MKNKEFYKLLSKNKSKSNAGFTLTELLVGLIMSIFVIGALGFGLMTVLRTTQSETSRVKARNETSRALDFISDEVRRASSIETIAGAGFSPTDSSGNAKTVVLALDIPEVTDSVNRKIVYYLKSDGNDNWKGPQVLYRWGPPLENDGSYNLDPSVSWKEEALIDGIDDTAIATSPCTGGDTLSPTTARGFHACINGAGNSAQLYLTGGTDTIAGAATDTYTADTKVVARARTAPANKVNVFNSYTMSFKTLGATYNCNPNAEMWKMRTDFGNDPLDADNTTSWIHQDDRQPQPIKIDTSNDLTITSVPVDPTPSTTTCLSKGAPSAPSNAPLSDYTDGTYTDGHAVPHTIKFSGTDYWHTFNGDPASGSRDVIDVTTTSNGTVLMLKRGSQLTSDATTIKGYDYDGDAGSTAVPEDSLGEFLRVKGYADFTNGINASGGYTINNNLGTDERIMAVEVGHTDTTQPGFDVQDSVFILASDIFAQTHENTP